MLHLNVFHRKAGFYPYIVVYDYARNIAALVLPIPSNKDFFEPCMFRGDFAMTNIDRLLAAGLKEEDLELDLDYQPSLPLGIDNLVFGLIISYDREQETVFAGALLPSQEDWMFHEEITDMASYSDQTIPLPQAYEEAQIPLSFSKAALQEDEEIKLQLKD